MKLKPKTLTPEQLNKVAEVTAAQTGKQQYKRTLDDSEVFQIPVNEKILIYVPNHNEIIDGVEMLKMDKAFIHTVKNGNITQSIRCTAGIEELGYSSCPLCEVEQSHWDLVRLQTEETCKKQGIDPNDRDSDHVKSIWRKFKDSMALAGHKRKYTFPIAVIDARSKDEDGLPTFKIVWYSISEKFYKDKWGTALLSIQSGSEELDFDAESTVADDVVLPSPGGRVFELDFTYDDKENKHNKVQSALHLKVIPKSVGDKWKPLLAKIEEEAKSYTVERCVTTVVDNLFYEEEDMRAIADEITAPVLQRIALYESIGGSNSGIAGLPGSTAPTAGSIEAPVEVLETDDLEEIL